MIPESIWPGMFHADAGSGNVASVKTTKAMISDTAGCHLCHIGCARGKENVLENVLDNRQ